MNTGSGSTVTSGWSCASWAAHPAGHDERVRRAEGVLQGLLALQRQSGGAQVVFHVMDPSACGNGNAPTGDQHRRRRFAGV